VGSDERVAKGTAEAEALWQGLRRTEGVSLEWFSERFGENVLNLFADQLKPWFESGSLIVEGDMLRLTDEGLPFADSVAGDLF
jgi:coproporphyrinogen III oxidase-like Fe-S oxidoreductase